MSSTENPCVGFGLHLRQLRQARGLSQEELANRAGLDRTYVSSCEAGRRNVTLKTIVKLADALELSPAALIEPGQDTTRVAEGSAACGSDE
jgi:transcriptional regulator with XRE-family HTH domain